MSSPSQATCSLMSSATARTTPLPPESVGIMLASMFCFAIVDTLAKAVALHYPPNEVTFFRMSFGLVPAFAMCLGGRRSLADRVRTLDLKGQALRAVTLVGASSFFF